MQQTDLYWVEKLRSKRERDFNEFFDHFFPRLYRFANSRLRDANLAEEVVQEALGKAIINIHSYLGEAALFTWLCTITRHEISRVLKREEISLNQAISIADENLLAALDSLGSFQAEDPHHQINKLQLAEKVRLVMASLPSHYADILEWRYLHGDSVKEIAEKIDKSYKSTESLLSRARDVFRDAFISIHKAEDDYLNMEGH
ncbi:RNA polymerase sigma factor [Cellvibrio zantedeschiae]|uniref:RNA polymerase sigma factor n=1 Tax=Cellvibrio zantedeschiae TaxID=1237077 RepID=A0ABQ3B9H5_9GAMM|nr:RNA polymerase sigma factor [Cellvibrio zantedeschiae]GGY81684.1 RNA polymerase sigma factor [Cellvibrio zantedeschiae]